MGERYSELQDLTWRDIAKSAYRAHIANRFPEGGGLSWDNIGIGQQIAWEAAARQIDWLLDTPPTEVKEGNEKRWSGWRPKE